MIKRFRWLKRLFMMISFQNSNFKLNTLDFTSKRTYRSEINFFIIIYVTEIKTQLLKFRFDKSMLKYKYKFLRLFGRHVRNCTWTAWPSALALTKKNSKGDMSPSTPLAQDVYSNSFLLYFYRAYEMSQESQSPLGQWSNKYSSVLATLGCTLGAFNISRFAILTVQFGGESLFFFVKK